MNKDERIKKQQAALVEYMEVITRLERVRAFFDSLSDMGFIIDGNPFYIDGKCYHYVKHYLLKDINSMFTMNENEMTISECTIDRGSWIFAAKRGEPIITCKNFIEWLKIRVRETANDIIKKV